MNIVPKDGPTITKPATASSRQRAIDAFKSASQAQPEAVKNPTQVSPEEMGAIIKKTEQSDTSDSVQAEAPPKQEEAKSADSDSKPKTEDPLSPQYALLARKEKALRANAQAIKAREDAIKAKEAELASKDAEYASKYIQRDKLLADPLSILSELGISYDELTNKILGTPTEGQPSQELQALKAEIKAIKDAQDQANQAAKDNQQNQYKQAVNQIRNEAKALVNSDPNLETIKVTNSVNDVVELIEKTFAEEGRLMTVEEAAAEVEEYLIEEGMKLARIEKIQKRLQPKVETPPKQSEPKQQQQPTMKTLTNAVTASKPLTARERAMLAFKGQLNNK